VAPRRRARNPGPRRRGCPARAWLSAGGWAGAGFVKIKQFDTSTAEAVKGALEANAAAGATCSVVDLRDNAGGYFAIIVVLLL
jgi:C-terminal processing protease CtpA/Prc